MEKSLENNIAEEEKRKNDDKYKKEKESKNNEIAEDVLKIVLDHPKDGDKQKKMKSVAEKK